MERDYTSLNTVVSFSFILAPLTEVGNTGTTSDFCSRVSFANLTGESFQKLETILICKREMLFWVLKIGKKPQKTKQHKTHPQTARKKNQYSVPDHFHFLFLFFFIFTLGLSENYKF